MATTDVFNNSANNYVNPGLSPCAGAGDDAFLEFLPNKSIGVIQGGNTLAGISFSDIKIPVEAYSSQKKVLEPGEVTFIAGLTKGLSYRSQSFTIPSLVSTDETKNPYFMIVDLSVGFYKNFGYKLFNLEASADYANNISINQALDIAFSNLQAKISSAYDPSYLGFTGTQLGWDFNISNVILTVIDVSENSESPFSHPAYSEVLEEDLSLSVLYAKYPNSAMQGIIMKVSYPSDASSIYDEWIFVNHVPDIATIYEPTQVNNFISGIQYLITFDPSITFGPFIDPSALVDASIGLDASDGSESFVFAQDSSFSTYDLVDSSLYNSRVNLTSTLLRTTLEKSWVNKDYPLLPYGDPSSKVIIAVSTINDSSIFNAEITDSSLFKTFLQDVSLSDCTLYNCSYDPSEITLNRCRIIRINESIDPSIAYDSSTFYKPVIKTIEVGMSGCSNESQMSAGDYLEWITENDGWNKVGEMYIWTTAPDWSDTRNLIEGFYVFNPQGFSVQLEYLIFV